MPSEDRYRTYFDECWKKIIERLFLQMLKFFIPALYSDIDLSQEVVFLDKEMERISRRNMRKSKYVDKLAQVYLNNGSDQWILIHIEVQ